MIGHLYRYPHPHDPNKFIYCGQGNKRDYAHRTGRSAFGRRFKRKFPNTELTQPIRETVVIVEQSELNELETIWIFKYHTWHGYDHGMNVGLPGDVNYPIMGKIGGRERAKSGDLQKIAGLGGKAAAGRGVKKQPHEAKVRGGVIGGKYNVESGWIKKLGYIQGRKNSESGFIQRLGRAKGPSLPHIRWHVNRNKPNPRCAICSEQNMIFAWG